MSKGKRNDLLSTSAFSLAAKYGVEYISSIRERRVAPSKKDLDNLDEFSQILPIDGTSPEEIISELHRFGSPATVASTGGRYFGLVVGGATPASMAASVLTSAWDQVAVIDASAPSAVHLERIAANWMLALLGLPDISSVGFTTGSSVANMVCLAAARNEQYRALGVDLAHCGLAGAPPLSVIISEQAHVTVLKALSILGFGTDQIVRAPCDLQGKIKMECFPEIDDYSIVCLQAGNVNSGEFDPFAEIIPLAKSKGAWVHIDGAFGLWAAASPKRSHLVKYVELADSWAVDAHKWLNTPYDCGVAICRNPHAVHHVMTTQAPYITSGVQLAPKDMVPEFSRRARGVEVWAAIQEMGKSGISDLIEKCCVHAQTLAAGLRGLGFDVLNDVVLNQVVASIGTEETVHKIAKLVQAEGVCWLGTTNWQGKEAIRLSVSSWATTDEDIEKTLASIEKATKSLIR